MYVVIEFPGELNDTQGRPTGSHRGWIPAGDPALSLLPAQARVVCRTDDRAEAQALVEEGGCLGCE